MEKRNIAKYFLHPKKIIMYLAGKGLIPFDDEKYVRAQYEDIMGYKLNLEDPKSYNEKLQWLKLNNKKSEYTDLVDKYKVKEKMADLIGQEYIIPTLGVWDSFDEIDFEKLPNQFVIKCTHDSGGIFIVKNKANINRKNMKKKIDKLMKKNYFYLCREWPYKNVKPRLMAEKYMEDSSTKELRDYKFYCFNGTVKALLLATNRQNENEELNFDYFDDKFNWMNMTNQWHPNAKVRPQKPVKFEEMVRLAKKISIGYPHVRVDFYEVDDKVYFGELTFYDQGGYLQIHPDEWKYEWGRLIDLSSFR